MSDLKDLFVPYKLALQLKKKGFSEACLGAYSDSKELYISKVSFQSNFKGYCLAPTYDQITDWFINNHKIQLKAVAMDFEGKVKWFYECQDIKLYKTMHFDQKVLSITGF